MDMVLPNLDPLWVSVIVTAVLVFITGYYAWQAKKTTDISKMSLLYQRKPQVITLLFNSNNRIFFSLQNDKKSVSSVNKINIIFSLKKDEEEYILGEYCIDGPLFSDEKETQEITKQIRDILIYKKLMSFHTESIPEVDEYGYNYMADYTFYDIRKGKINFEIKTKVEFETDIKNIKQNKYSIERNFDVELSVPFGPPNDFDDNYETKIIMQTGHWVRTSDYLLTSNSKSKKIKGVKGLN